MAITWDVQITPINISTFEASILATRTDSENPGNPLAYTVSRASLETPALRLAAMDEIWDKHLAFLATTTAIETFVSEKEAAGKTNLEARE